MTELDEYWQKFLTETKRDPEEKCAGDLFFEAKGIVGDELVALVLGEKKTAIFSTYASYQIDMEPLPISGELYIVEDRAGHPRCVIELDSVNILPFNEVTWGMAQKEGEDENMDEWRDKKTEAFQDEADVLGFDFAPDLKLVFQVFHVVYR